MAKGRRKNLVEYSLYLPTKVESRSVKPAAVRSSLRKKLTKKFGGLTETAASNKGFWKIGPVTVRDKIMIWNVLSGLGSAGDSFVRKVQAQLERDLAQEQILVVRRKVRLL